MLESINSRGNKTDFGDQIKQSQKEVLRINNLTLKEKRKLGGNRPCNKITFIKRKLIKRTRGEFVAHLY